MTREKLKPVGFPHQRKATRINISLHAKKAFDILRPEIVKTGNGKMYAMIPLDHLLNLFNKGDYEVKKKSIIIGV